MPDEPLRAQMTAAMAAIHHQLELLGAGPTIGAPADDRSVIADLQSEYQALKDARDGLGPDVTAG